MLAARIAVQQIIVLRVEHDLDDIVHRMQLRAQREGRLDDANETVIRHRFEVYEQETKPVLDYYPASLRIEVNGIQAGPVHVAHDVLAGLIGRRAEMLPIPR
jgi:adenylate kinase